MLARVALAAIIAAAPTAHPRVVSANPVDNTPHVLDGIVNAITLVGGTVVVGGSFSAVADATRTTTYRRDNLFAYDLRTGRVLPRFSPEVGGTVHSLAAGDEGTVYVGGDFHEVDGHRARSLARLHLTTGQPVRSFRPAVSGGAVATLARQGGHLYAGGDFTRPRTALARLDPTTGRADPAFDITPGDPLTRKVKVHAIAATADRLAVDGNFTTLGGQSRPQIGLIDIGGPEAGVAPWRTDAYTGKCMDAFPWYVRGLDFAPDGSYFVVVTTGGPRRGLCDSAARFETYRTTQGAKPTWINRTGGDSLYAVSVTGSAVYVGGHLRWLDNPLGHDSAGRGAVPREGIGAIHPRTGKALSWNPGRERGIGVKAFQANDRGLLVGSDTTRLGREYHARIGMFPLP
ncbi:hypothetical protein [Nonomuraea sp. SBT364]|uniref:hypothetical protein n=1 Tax=Nonomuraea sp. SBT364 TaxID=1580530 RepID=UPI00066EAFB4|nr:hypothetical protein [Nonomuraea sp. SBT364]